MNQPTSTDSSISAPNRAPDAVSRRAYEIWEREGRPEGCDLRHWLQAEQELESENSSNSNVTSNAASGSRSSAPGASRNTGTDTRPLQGTRAAQAANRENRRNSGAPFTTDKNGTGTSTSSGGQNATKRKSSSTPMM